jgi:hypothetical protein
MKFTVFEPGPMIRFSELFVDFPSLLAEACIVL